MHFLNGRLQQIKKQLTVNLKFRNERLSKFYQQNTNQLVDRSKNSSRKDGISHKIGDHKHQFRRKDLGGSNLLRRVTANQGSLLTHHNYKIRIG